MNWKVPPGGFTPDQLHQRRLSRRRRFQAQVAAVVVVTLSAGAVASYQWVTKVTEVDQARAVDLFRAERNAIAAEQAEPETRTSKTRSAREARTEERRSTGRLRATRAHSARSTSVSSPQRLDRSSEPQSDRREPPEEGVYSWATDGFEQVSGARRQFPEETQRIITLEDNRSWTQHHYFSEERQIWTVFEDGPSGVNITQQRNEVTFGPVTKRTQIDFSPPMLAAPSELRVGYAWRGEWSGDTYGDYSSKIFERTTMVVGGQNVEVWGMVYVINLRGEQEGQVNAKVWFAPGPRLTVKEHYTQDVESGGSQYHAEWTQTLKSLEPKR